MPSLSEIRKSETGWNQAEAAKEFQQAYEEMHAKTLSISYAVKRLSLIESGAADATELELAALARVYKRDIEEIRQAAPGRQPDTPDETGEQFFAELKETPETHDVLICSVYGGPRSASNNADDEYGRLLIDSLQTPKGNVKLAMYLPFPGPKNFSTRDENPDSMRLIAAYDAARTYAHDRFGAIRREVPKGSIALYEPDVEAFLNPGEVMQPYLAPFNIRQMLVVTMEKTAERRVLSKMRLFAWTHDDRPSGGTIPPDRDRDSSLRQLMQAAWTAWMGEPLACWEQCGRLGDSPSVVEALNPEIRTKFPDFRVVSKDEKWGWRKTTLSRNISEKFTRAELVEP